MEFFGAEFVLPRGGDLRFAMNGWNKRELLFWLFEKLEYRRSFILLSLAIFDSERNIR